MHLNILTNIFLGVSSIIVLFFTDKKNKKNKRIK